MWYQGLDTLQKFYFITAIVSTALLVIQTIISLIFDGDSDVDGDADFDISSGDNDSGLQLFSIRGLFAFLAIGGWTGLLFTSIEGMHIAWAIVLSVLFGLAAFVGIAFLFRLLAKLQDDGTIDINSTLGKSGNVYLTIGANRSKVGKVTIEVSGRIMELDALTDSDKEIKTGSSVTVLSIMSQNILVVEPYSAKKD